jgi:hypothetical protein
VEGNPAIPRHHRYHHVYYFDTEPEAGERVVTGRVSCLLYMMGAKEVLIQQIQLKNGIIEAPDGHAQDDGWESHEHESETNEIRDI